MTEIDQIAALLALTLGAAWASGINLYAAILVLGLGGATGYIDLPEALHIIQDPVVLMAAGLMYCVEFFADKTPGVDSGWDAIHTFIRIPAGALLAAGSVGDVSPALMVAAGIVGGALTAATHATKAGSRVLINTSPEPLSNWSASLAEDLAVLGGLWMALTYPWLFLALLLLFILLMIWLLPKLWRGVRTVLNKLGQWLGLSNQQDDPPPAEPDPVDKLLSLQRMREQEMLSEEEFTIAKRRILAAGEAASNPHNPSHNKE